MIIWIDAQLSPALAGWMRGTFGVQAQSLKDLGLRDATDRKIFEAARAHGNAVILTKDSDFVALVEQFGPPPRIIWLTCGNTSNRNLQSILMVAFPKAKALIDAGEPMVEIQ